MSGQVISEVQCTNIWGLFFSQDLRWNQQIEHIKSKAWPRINIMRHLKFRLHRDSLETIYTSFIRPIFEYGDVLFDSCTIQEKGELEKIQQEAARIVTGTTKLVSIQRLLDEVVGKPWKVEGVLNKLILFLK